RFSDRVFKRKPSMLTVVEVQQERRELEQHRSSLCNQSLAGCRLVKGRVAKNHGLSWLPHWH
ncbi:MAG TPA: hypothetical protein V6D03_02925, partial [Candidatus Caenarcaniphilales bacterium]